MWHSSCHANALGDGQTETPREVTLSVQTLDNSALPADTTVLVMRKLGYHEERLTVESEGKSSGVVKLPAIGGRMLKMAVIANGYQVTRIRTLPELAPDLNQFYRLDTYDSTNLAMVIISEK